MSLIWLGNIKWFCNSSILWGFLLSRHYYLQMLNNSEKNPNLMDTLFSIYMVNKWPHENILKKSVGPRKKIEVKGGRLVKKWEFCQTKKNLYINFLKRNHLLLWSMVDFRLKIAQNWDLSSEIKGFPSLGYAPSKASNAWISDDKSQFWAIFRWKLTIGHKSKYFFL